MFKRKFPKLSVGVIVTNAIRIVLIIGFFSAFVHGRDLAMAFRVIAFIATYTPRILAKLGIKTGSEMQVVILLIIYGSLFLGEVRGFYASLEWWDILLKAVASLALSFVGLTIILTLEEQEILNASKFMTITLAFALSFTLGAVWEIIEFSLDEIFGFSLQEIGTGVVAQDLIIDGLAALIISIGGYWYKKKGFGNPMSGIIVKMMRQNNKLFRSEKNHENEHHKIKAIINSGEGPKVEFKSSIRTNLHTNTFDKNIENALLKTVAAYLNTNGGTLMVGVSDKGEIVGLEKDSFPSDDKLKLHVNNMIKDNLGAQFMSFVNTDLIEIEGKKILKIEALPSNKRVFLKDGNQEEFYIRNGPASIKLFGNALIDYVNDRFN